MYKCEKCGKEYKSRNSLQPIYIQGTGAFKRMCQSCGIKYMKEVGFLEDAKNETEKSE